MKQRLGYIDELKGLAIFLVVVGHVYIISFGFLKQDQSSLWDRLISSFHMPLFAFLSGLFMSGEISRYKLKSKIERLVFPFFTIGVPYIYWRGLTISDFFMDNVNYGFWYLKIIFISWLIVILYTHITIYVFPKRNLCIDVFVGIVFYFLLYLIPVGSLAYLTLSWDRMIWLFPYILAGHLIMKYNMLDIIFSKEKWYSIIIIIAIACWITMVYFQHGRARYLLTPCLVYLIFSLFYRVRDKNTGLLHKTLLQWGGQSLEIYVIHVFLLHSTYVYMPREYLTFNSGFLILLANIVLSTIIVLSSIYISRIIKTSHWLGYICFGEKYK